MVEDSEVLPSLPNPQGPDWDGTSHSFVAHHGKWSSIGSPKAYFGM